jgi:hypothetical protein
LSRAIKIDASVGQRRELGAKLDGLNAFMIPRIDARIVAQFPRQARMANGHQGKNDDFAAKKSTANCGATLITMDRQGKCTGSEKG